MKSIGIIPARGGSKGVPKKNIKELFGKPLIAYTIEASQKSNLDKIVVSTDSIDIARVATEYGVEVIMRPQKLSSDNAPTLPVLKHVLTSVEGFDPFSNIVTLQPTSPFRTAKHINESLELMNEDVEADSLVSVVKVPHSMTPESLMTIEGAYLVNHLHQKDLVLRRQDKMTYFARNGAAIYITKRNRIDEFVFGGRIIPYEMGALESVDIDSLDDWKIAEALMVVARNE